ncbi:HAMP domain-containing protein [Nocardioides sp.]|uniref:HAMP domain-containing protein n=1 Tax=Nocardioides sp. TaxID=35761 RepID=UPI0039E2D696
MRKRLTVAFIVLTVAFCLIGLIIRTVALDGSLRQHESRQIHEMAIAVGTAVDLRLSQGQPVDEQFLAGLVGAESQIRLHLNDSNSTMTASGPRFDGAEDPSQSDDLWAAYETSEGTVIVSQSKDVSTTLLQGQGWSLVLFFGLLAFVAGIVGYLLARQMVEPFRRLAAAAAALGRGRFDLDLPTSKVPEVRAIASALKSSATQLQDRIGAERAFAEHASHVLRTPLTSLRLELDDLAANGDLPPTVCDAVGCCVQRIDDLDAVAGELIAMTRRGTVILGTEVPLRELATMLAQRWADELAQHDRTFTAAVEGDLDTAYTPGPVEHIHELLLVDVIHRSRGAVRLTYEATPEGPLKLHVVAAEPARGRAKPPGSPYQRAVAVVAALGGRLVGEYVDQGIDIVLPHR